MGLQTSRSSAAALDVARLHKGKGSLTEKLKRAGWNDDFMLQLLNQNAIALPRTWNVSPGNSPKIDWEVERRTGERNMVRYNPLFSATTCGRGLRSTSVPGQFTLRVYTGGFATNGTAEAHATDLLDKHKADNQYSAYEIVERTSRWFPSCVDYVVRFQR
jgi:hypothetical protein